MLKGTTIKDTDKIVEVKESAWNRMMREKGVPQCGIPPLAIARVLNSRKSAAAWARELRARVVVRSPGQKPPSEALPRRKKTPRGGGGGRKSP